MLFYPGNIVTVTLHFKKIEVQDDAERGRYECVGTSATGAEKPHGFNIKVTPSKSAHIPTWFPGPFLFTKGQGPGDEVAPILLRSCSDPAAGDSGRIHGRRKQSGISGKGWSLL